MKKLFILAVLLFLASDLHAQNYVTEYAKSLYLAGGRSDPANTLRIQVAASTSGGLTWTLPASNGSSGQALITDGAGNLSWQTFSGGGVDSAHYILNLAFPFTETQTANFNISGNAEIRGILRVDSLLETKELSFLNTSAHVTAAGYLYWDGTWTSNRSAGYDSAKYILNRYTPQQIAGFNIAAGAPAKTADFSEATILNDATSSTAGADKRGLEIESTGTWNGSNANNDGIHFVVTGGTNNYDLYGTSGSWQMTSAGALFLGVPLTLASGGTGTWSSGDVNKVLTSNGTSAPSWQASGGSFIVNGTSLQTSANFNIDGDGQMQTGIDVGTGNSNVGNGYIASATFGVGLTIAGDYEFVQGLGSLAAGTYAVAFGDSTQAGGNYSFSGGQGTIANGDWSVAMGDSTIATGNYATAFGHNANAGGTSSLATGKGTIASGLNSTAMGLNTIAGDAQSTAMGNGTSAGGLNSTAMGQGSSAGGNQSTAMGYQTHASNDQATTMGTSTTASGNSSTAMGISTTADYDATTAMGYHTTADANYATATGQSTIASGQASTSMGKSTTAGGLNGTAMGDSANAYYANSFCWSDGAYTITSAVGQFLIHPSGGFEVDGGIVTIKDGRIFAGRSPTQITDTAGNLIYHVGAIYHNPTPGTFSNYFITNYDNIVVDSCTGAGGDSIQNTLPANPAIGEKIIVVNVGTSSSDNIIDIYPNTGQVIQTDFTSTTNYPLIANFTLVEFIYRGAGSWIVR